MIEEAHRQTMQTMILMYLSTFRSRSSVNPDELIKEMRKNPDSQTINLAEAYLKLQRNYMLDKKQLAVVREQFKEEQTKRAKIVMQRERKISSDVILTDKFHPMNHIGYRRFKKWEEETSVKEVGIIGKRHTLFRKNAVKNFYDPTQRIRVKPVPMGLDDMVNILMSINYLSGFSKFQGGGDKDDNQKPAKDESSESSQDDPDKEQKDKQLDEEQKISVDLTALSDSEMSKNNITSLAETSK